MKSPDTGFLIVASRSPGESRYALCRDGRVTDVIVVRDASRPYGSIHLGRVVGSVRGAVWVDMGSARPGFLPRENFPASGPPPEGTALLVQVVQEEQHTKGAKISARITLAGSLAVWSPFRAGVNVSRRLGEETCARLLTAVRPMLAAGEGAVLRHRAAGVEPSLLHAEIDSLRRRWQALRVRVAGVAPPVRLDDGPDPLIELVDRAGSQVSIVCDDGAFLARARALERVSGGKIASVRLEPTPGALFETHGIESDLTAALEREVPLAGGGRLIIEPATALTAIDVDTAAAGLDAADAVNLAAVDIIAWQMRLRNLSGALVVDFVTCWPIDRLRRVVAALRAVVASDPLPVQVYGPSPLGLVEMIRNRCRAALADVLRQGCCGMDPDPVTVGLSALRLVLRETAARRCTGLGLALAPSVAEPLRGSPAVAEAERHLGHRLVIRADPTCRLEDIMVIPPAERGS
ncbi:MAG: ribonuclease G [Rhodospirillaceae bacterium]|nr:MAG: ribonuclease G [Rhodospirillaceae bacterium]